MAEFTQGDYTYTTSVSSVAVVATDKTKRAYGDIPDYVTYDGTRYQVTSMNMCFKDCNAMTYAPPIPTGVVSMQGAFWGCSSLVSPPILKGNSVTNMNSAFNGCSALATPPDLSAQSGLFTMGSAFENCSSLQEPPAMPARYTSTGTQRAASFMFKGCTSLRMGPDLSGLDDGGLNVNMPGAFWGCESLEEPPRLPATMNANGGQNGLYGMFYGCSSLTEAPVLPSDAIGSAAYCFRDCSSLVEAPQMPSGISSMEQCFYYCTSLVEAPAIPASATNMSRCFYRCSSLKSAPNIPSGVTNMAECFYGCEAMTTPPASIPSSVTTMEDCFGSCRVLASPPNMSAATGVTTMEGCFMGCWSLASAPNLSGMSSLTNMYWCFLNCRSLVEPPTIPGTVEAVTECFSGCSSLRSAPAIPGSVLRMSGCFEYCVALTGTVTVASTQTDPTDVFDGTREPIFIVLDGAADETIWRAIADQYENVFFFADANSKPALSFEAKRVAADQDTVEDTGGTWVYVTATATAYKDRLPEGYGNSIASLSMRANGQAEAVTWQVVSTEEVDFKVTRVYRGWFEATTAKQALAMTVTDEYAATSPTITAVLASTRKLLNLLRGSLGMGLAIGKRATRDGFDCVLPAYFGADVTIESSAIDRDSQEAPSADAWSNGFFINDADGERLARFQAVRRSASYGGRMDAGVYVYAEPFGGGTQVYNSFLVCVAPDGTRSYVVGDKGAFREAIDMGVTGGDLTLGTEFAAYNAARTPRYRKQGNVVCLWGAVKPTSNITGDLTTKHTIGTLPSGYRPQAEVTALCQGSGGSIWTLEITTGGVVTAARYRNGSTAVDITTSMWMPFSVTFFA